MSDRKFKVLYALFAMLFKQHAKSPKCSTPTEVVLIISADVKNWLARKIHTSNKDVHAHRNRHEHTKQKLL